MEIALSRKSGLTWAVSFWMFCSCNNLTAPCLRRYGDAEQDSSNTGRPELHRGKRREGELLPRSPSLDSYSTVTTKDVVMFQMEQTYVERKGELEFRL